MTSFCSSSNLTLAAPVFFFFLPRKSRLSSPAASPAFSAAPSPLACSLFWFSLSLTVVLSPSASRSSLTFFFFFFLPKSNALND